MRDQMLQVPGHLHWWDRRDTLARDWLNTNDRHEMAMSTITLLNTITTDETSNRRGLTTCIRRILRTSINDLL